MGPVRTERLAWPVVSHEISYTITLLSPSCRYVCVVCNPKILYFDSISILVEWYSCFVQDFKPTFQVQPVFTKSLIWSLLTFFGTPPLMPCGDLIHDVFAEIILRWIKPVTLHYCMVSVGCLNHYSSFRTSSSMHSWLHVHPLFFMFGLRP